jgi:hypothetical protein
LEEWIRRWERFVSRVESGYTMTVYDYLNDIDTRRILDGAIEVASQNCSEVMHQTLQPLDARYLVATVEANARDPWRRPGDPWYRHPRKLLGELKEDLEPFI